MLLDQPSSFAHFLLDQAVRPGDVVIDATVGHGDDTLFLAEKVADYGHVYGFDIQKEALATCQKRLTTANLNQQVSLINQGHERIITALPADLKVQAAIFSLGSLRSETPQSVTLPNTTISAYHQVLSRLNRGGMLLFIIDNRFFQSEEEIHYLVADLTRLNPERYAVRHFQGVNQDVGQLLTVIKK
ncbi:class I SAM-dependent methyltransferase [Latilactobacillus sp. 5-91]|uniref:class I SAM-dependent methyltransferase n=1 Tax=Latilactobacillus sp. 5-91 TaxID=3410924 RepID=UPI003C715789